MHTLSRKEYIETRRKKDQSKLIIPYLKDIGVFKKDADPARIAEFLHLYTLMNPTAFSINYDDIYSHYDKKFEIMYIIRNNVIIDIR